MASSHSASFDLTQEEDDEIVDIENRARPRQAAFMPGKLKKMFISSVRVCIREHDLTFEDSAVIYSQQSVDFCQKKMTSQDTF